MGLHSMIGAGQQCKSERGRGWGKVGRTGGGRCVGSVHPVTFLIARCACCKNRKTKAAIVKIVKILISAYESIALALAIVWDTYSS